MNAYLRFQTIIAILFLCSAALESAEHENHIFFERQVRPIVVNHCIQCHGPKKQENGLRLDTRAGWLAGAEDGAVVTVGKPGDSSLIESIHYRGDFEMPPKKRLTIKQADVIAEWIQRGLPWPEPIKAITQTPDELRRYTQQTHWSLQPLTNPTLPKLASDEWSETSVDRLVLARLQQHKLSPSPAADRYTLVRRATFDLLGLPPSVAEVEAFVKDDRPDAYERLLDRLLASPRYGERWGRHWLDVARYADTRGYAIGREARFPYAYTYRDYVIASFNSDLPFDQFIREQLAADQLADQPSPNPSLAALGFLTVGRKYSKVQDNIDDQIDLISRGLLGLTVACARCHDHKSDAITQEDYYALYGVFASSTSPKELPLITDPATTPGYKAFKAELNKRQAAVDKFASDQHRLLLEHAREKVGEYLHKLANEKPVDPTTKKPGISLGKNELKPKLITAWRSYLNPETRKQHPIWRLWATLIPLPDAQVEKRAKELAGQWKALPADKFHPHLNKALQEKPPTSKTEVAALYGKTLLAAYKRWKEAGGNQEARAKADPADRALIAQLLDQGTPTVVPLGAILGYLARDVRDKHRSLTKNVDSHRARGNGAPPRAMSLVDNPRPTTPHVLLRGNPNRPGKQVERRFLHLLSKDPPQPFSTKHSGRLELAEAIVAKDNPLTARVIANRVWGWHFGQSLVVTPSDFGVHTPPPSHPQLLDHLAATLIEDGWSLKKLHRRIMLSATYRQASSRREECAKVDPDNRWLWRMNSRRLELEALRDSILGVGDSLDLQMGGKPADILAQTQRSRRTIYGLVDRQFLPGLYRVFDFASPDSSSSARPSTTVPQQALFLMNSPLVIQQATILAKRTEREGVEDRDRVDQLYRMILSRKASEIEITEALDFLQAVNNNKEASDKLPAWPQLAQALLASNSFMFID